MMKMGEAPTCPQIADITASISRYQGVSPSGTSLQLLGTGRNSSLRMYICILNTDKRSVFFQRRSYVSNLYTIPGSFVPDYLGPVPRCFLFSRKIATIIALIVEKSTNWPISGQQTVHYSYQGQKYPIWEKFFHLDSVRVYSHCCDCGLNLFVGRTQIQHATHRGMGASYALG